MVSRERLFDEGVRAFRVLVEHFGAEDAVPPGAWYPCPLCTNLFDRDELAREGELTVEHVPPQAVGGRGVLLTCRACNNLAGQRFDHEAAEFERIRRFAAREAGVSRAAKLTSGEVSVRALARIADDGEMQFVVADDHNNPADVDKFFSIARNQQQTFRVNIPLGDRESDHVLARSWVRTAYLAAFAVLGWAYVQRDVMQPVRQLFDGEAGTTATANTPENYYFDPSPANRDLTQIIFVDAPESCRSITVRWRGHFVILPAVRGGRPLADLVQAHRHHKAESEERGIQPLVSGLVAGWPEYPMYQLRYPKRPSTT